VMLSNLRPADGSKVRPIPKGFLFNLVSCPNYYFEVRRQGRGGGEEVTRGRGACWCKLPEATLNCE